MILPEKVYDLIKWLSQVVIPALGALYLGIAQLLEWQNAEKVVAILALICTFINVVLGISSRQYFKSGEVFDGSVVMVPGETGELEAHAGLVTSPEKIADKTHIVLRVASPDK